MRVLVAGPTGVIGRQLVPLLQCAGYQVTGMLRSPERAAAFETTGAQAVVADGLDRAAVVKAVAVAEPDAIVHVMTAIPAEINPRSIGRDFAVTNRLRTEGTRAILDAARQVGVRRVITQGLAYVYAPGAGPAGEDAPWWSPPPKRYASALAALVELEQLTQEAGGLVLRVGQLYGPGSAFAADGSVTKQIKAGKLPLVGGGHAVFSFIHAHDAATAVVAAIERDVVGAINIVDDDPAPVSEWVPEVAELLGAPKPGSVPAWLARMAVGGWGVAYLNELRGADNARARLTLDWKPRYGSWRTGLARELSGQ